MLRYLELHRRTASLRQKNQLSIWSQLRWIKLNVFGRFYEYPIDLRHIDLSLSPHIPSQYARTNQSNTILFLYSPEHHSTAVPRWRMASTTRQSICKELCRNDRVLTILARFLLLMGELLSPLTHNLSDLAFTTLVERRTE